MGYLRNHGLKYHLTPDVPANRDDIQRLLYGRGPSVRYTQDSAILPDVWLKFAQWPGRLHDLLVIPYQSAHRRSCAGEVAAVIRRRLSSAWARSKDFERKLDERNNTDVAYNQSSVAVRLYLDELLRVVLPLSSWWDSAIRNTFAGLLGELEDPQFRRLLSQTLAGEYLGLLAPARQAEIATLNPDLIWLLRVVGTVLRIHEQSRSATSHRETSQLSDRPMLVPTLSEIHDRDVDDLVEALTDYFAEVVDAFRRIFHVESGEQMRELAGTGDMISTDHFQSSSVFHVSLNRPARLCVWRSTQAIKADAARNLFDISCSQLNWAIIDDGVDARHIAFRKRKPEGAAHLLNQEDWSDMTRVLGTYDFTKVRTYLSTEDGGRIPAALLRQLPNNERERFLEYRRQLHDRLTRGLDIDWSLLLPLIKIPHTDTSYQPPRRNEHGTHVAGILAGDWRQRDDRILQGETVEPFVHPTGNEGAEFVGVCRDINIFDLRVIDEYGRGDEFSVMAALQFVRYLNTQSGLMTVHGVNLSLAMLHDVTNYACGRTPICVECDRLIGDGIVVVAAAGNEGWKQDDVGITSTVGSKGYEDISITDPGNAESVITVGSTHRGSPHNYGVSYFSSRGPTGDGRCKPDLVAPGEKIVSSTPNHRSKRMDGTSMAAPHVSGACALLMARHVELIGQPRRIKQILCDSATDLGRERYFQGFGMVDVLRALQSI